MELRQLRYFVAVAEHLHFGRAAMQLNIAQPALSQQILRLENRLSVRLFERNRRRVALTAAGERFLPHARAVLREADRALEVARQAARGDVLWLEIGYAPPADLRILPRMAAWLGRHHPDLKLELRNLSGRNLVNAVQSGVVHVAILRLPYDTQDLVTETVLRERLVAVLPADHALASRRQVPLRCLADERFILFSRQLSPHYYDRLAAICEEFGGFTLAVSQEAETIQTTLGLVSAGLGVSLQPESAAVLGREGVAYRPLAEDVPMVETGIAYRRCERPEILEAIRGALGALAEAPSEAQKMSGLA